MATRIAEFPLTEGLLRHSSDAIFVFFCAYLMTRYTTFLTTKRLPAVHAGTALDIAGIAFGVTAMISFAGLARRVNRPSLIANFVTVLLTSFLAGSGVLSGLIGHSGISAGMICGIIAAISASHVVGSFAGLLGGIAGSIVAGKFFGVENVMTGITAGIIAGLVVTIAVVVTSFFVGTCVAFSLVSLIGEDNPRFPVDFFIGLPTCLASGIAGGFAAWFCDSLALEFIGGLKEVPDGFIGGVICGLAVGFVFGVNLGFTMCYEQMTNPHQHLRGN